MAHIVQAVTIRWYNACADYAVKLSRGLSESGHKISMAGSAETPAIKKAVSLGLPVIDLMDSYPDGKASFFQKAAIYRKYVRSNKVDLVNVHTGRDHLLWAYALRGTDIPLIRTSGNQLPPNSNIFSQFLNRRKTAGFIVSCEKIRGFYSEIFKTEKSSIPVINGGVDSGFFNPQYQKGKLREIIGIPQGAFVFGILARFSPDKGYRDFFNAAGKIVSDYPDVWFVAAGKNAQMKDSDIREMAVNAGVIERTRFPGFIPDVRDMIGSIDVGVVASVGSETICRIAMEYMSMGIPVLGTDTNVIPEVVRNGECGIIVPARNPDAMAEGMVKMLKSGDRIIEMGHKGVEIVDSEYSLKSFTQKSLEAYGRITGNEF